MIVVIADDLTGAGEIGGIGLACGLKVQLQTRTPHSCDADLLVVDSDTRSCSPDAAGKQVRDIAQKIKSSNLDVELIYKKTDSVLRGPVAAELDAIMEVFDAERVLLIPANPSKGRTVSNGMYYINGVPLDETQFAHDPEYPAATCGVLDLAGLSGADRLYLAWPGQTLFSKGISVGQAQSTDDLVRFCSSIDNGIIAAGAGEFFEKLLVHKGFVKTPADCNKDFIPEHKALFVCGSSTVSSRQAIRKAQDFGAKVCSMPEELFFNDAPEAVICDGWADEIGLNLSSRNAVIMAIDREPVENAGFARKLSDTMAETVSKILDKHRIPELFIEGGATACRIVDRLGFNRFEPCDLLADGVVRMKVLNRENTFITIKPGSYRWPENIWRKNTFQLQ